jgi:FixJ family two-component response regulator
MSGSDRGERARDQAVVFVVDDDPAVRRTLERMLRAKGCEVRTFGSASEFLGAHDLKPAGCIILDLALPGMDGLELQRRLAAEGCRTPIVFLTAQGDIPTSVRAIKAGAVNVLDKPVEKAHLLRALDEALDIDAAQRQMGSVRSAAEHRLGTLTARERQVLEHVVAGRLNKQIAADLGVVEDTVKMHRGRAMRKLGVRSLAELVRFMLRASCVGNGVLPAPAVGDPGDLESREAP